MYRASGPSEMRPVGETEFVAGIAAMSDSGLRRHPRRGWHRGLRRSHAGRPVEPVLEAHIRAGGGRFRGVRHSGTWDADPIIGNGAPGPGVYRRAGLPDGLARLTALGLSLDAWVFHTHSPTRSTWPARSRARTSSWAMRRALGYGPYAGRRDEVFAAWKAGMTELAKCPNVTMKLGGMMMRCRITTTGLPTPPSSEELAGCWRPYIETCIELFGADRCMFESNFPVEKMGIGFAALWNAFKRIAAGASADEKLAMFSGTARRIYRLE